MYPATVSGRLCCNGFLFGGAAAGFARAGAAVVFLIENLPGPGSSRTIGGASSTANGMSSSEISPFFAFSRCLVTTVRRRRSLVRRSRWRAQPTVSRERSPANRTRRLRNTSPSETCVASGTASSTSVAATRTAPVVPIRPRNASARARPTMPPVSASSPYIRRRPSASEISIGSEKSRMATPAALDAGFGSGRPQKRRQPSTKTRPVTPQAARPKRA